MLSLKQPRVQIWPVIHATSVSATVAQARDAGRAGVDGIFLINHDANHALLADCIGGVHEDLPELPLGANVIRETPAASLRILGDHFGAPPPLDSLWTDDAQLSSPLGPERSVAVFDDVCRELGWSGTHFGGVAFKYQAFVPDEDLSSLGRLARQWVDVPTTSGPGTGQAIQVNRLQLLREGLGDHPLALASGVSTENIGVMAPFVTHVLVSTSIATRGVLDPMKLAALMGRLDARH